MMYYSVNDIGILGVLGITLSGTFVQLLLKVLVEIVCMSGLVKSEMIASVTGSDSVFQRISFLDPEVLLVI